MPNFPLDLMATAVGANGGDFINNATEYTASDEIRGFQVTQADTKIQYIHNESHSAASANYISASLPLGLYMGSSGKANWKYIKLYTGSLAIYF